MKTQTNTQTGQALECAGEKMSARVEVQDRTDLLNLEGLGCNYTLGDVSQAIIKQMGMKSAMVLGEAIVKRIEYMQIVTEKARKQFMLPRTDNYKEPRVSLSFEDCVTHEKVSTGWDLADFKSANSSDKKEVSN